MIGQFLQRKVPIHFGGMSDPFQTQERTYQISRHFLEALLAFQYPTVISTRSAMPASEPYLGLLRELKPLVVQFSFSSTRAEISRRVEPNSPEPSALLRTIEALSNNGVQVACRWQPYIAGVSERPREFMRRVASTGVRHVAIEHLKVPLETGHPLWAKLCLGVGRNLYDDYIRMGATRNGRELVLPPAAKLPLILEAREAAKEFGISFGAADNDLQYLSSSACCCSGVDQFSGFEGWFKHQIAHAVRSCRGQPITYGSISGFWLPEGSVDRWVNSHSRIGRLSGTGSTLRDHIKARWNNPRSAFSPSSFYGVEPTESFTQDGFRVFRWKDGILKV